MLKKQLLIILVLICFKGFANDGYKLWLQYDYIKNETLRLDYQADVKNLMHFGDTETIKVALKELELGFAGMLDSNYKSQSKSNSVLILGNRANLSKDIKDQLGNSFNTITDEGFIIKSFTLKGKSHIVITGKSDVAVLYGVYHFLEIDANEFILKKSQHCRISKN